MGTAGDPRRERHEPGRPAPAPDGPGCGLHGRHPVAHDRGERAGQHVREPLGEAVAQLAGGERLRREQGLTRGGDGVEVGAPERVPSFLVRGQAPVEHGLHEGAEGGRVGHGHQVDGSPHDDGADDHAVEQEAAEVVGHEAVEAAEELVVGRPGGLGLEADQVRDGVERGHRRALEEELAGERGPVELPPADAVGQRAAGLGLTGSRCR
jgi:hypothetical protein